MSRFSHVLLSSAAARVRGPSYRRGDEPARVVSPARLQFVLEYCRAADAPASDFRFFAAHRIWQNAESIGVV
ncbi:hypothetical protein [Nitrospira sp. BLG_2]|uniref:hypothetical protein n=1 Tax=Nitrospira sp. BLG_2 TaxID=3397507 RepID=UPI003B9BF555